MLPPARPSTAAGARVAIRALRRQLYNVDPDNEAHVNAYLALRATQRRVTGQHLEWYIGTLNATVAHGDEAIETRETFWAVPRINFPDGCLPASCIYAVVPPEHTTDFPFLGDDYYFIYQVNGLCVLGPGVATCSRVVTSPTAGSLGAASGGGAATGDGAATFGDSGAGGTLPLTNGVAATGDVRDATGGGASAATGDGAATGGGSGACGTLPLPCDTYQAALDAARADNDKWEWGSRVQWWQSDKEWTE